MTQTAQYVDAGTVLWIGPIDDDCRAAVARRTTLQASAAARDAVSEQALEPALIVVAEEFPGQHAADDLQCLRRRFPTAAWLRVIGPWCEGELRSWPPSLAAPRCRRHEAAAWLARQFANLQAGRCPEWGLPATMTEEERLTRRESLPSRNDAMREPRVAVVGSDPAVAQWLATVCRPHFRYVDVVRASREIGSSPQLIVWASPAGSAIAGREFDDLRHRFHTTPLVVVAGFPRREFVAPLRARQIRLVTIPAQNDLVAAELLAAVDSPAAAH